MYRAWHSDLETLLLLAFCCEADGVGERRHRLDLTTWLCLLVHDVIDQ